MKYILDSLTGVDWTKTPDGGFVSAKGARMTSEELASARNLEDATKIAREAIKRHESNRKIR